MHRYEISSFPDATRLAEAAARHWIRRLEENPPLADAPLPRCVALSGGRIAGPFYDDLVRFTGNRTALWNDVEFFFADERWVDLDDPESNYRLARERLFDPLDIPQRRRHPLAGGASREFAAAQAQAELVRLAPASLRAQPILDLAILGMGEDGHIASLFPGAGPDILDSRAVYLPVEGPKPPPERITLTGAVLVEARAVWVLISGSGKRAALDESLRPGGGTPLARLIQQRSGPTRLFTDFPV